MAESIEFFFVDGKETSFADVLCSRKITGESLFVATYGFGSKQIRKLLGSFESVVLVADESHSIISKVAYNAVVGMSENLDNFKFRVTRNHAKLAIIDNEVVVFTSANLSQNAKRELYFIYPASSEVIEKIYCEFSADKLQSIPSAIVDDIFNEDTIFL